jgi:hypothetical protein
VPRRRGEVSLAPLLPCPPAPLLPEGAMEQCSEASVLADVGQGVNDNAMLG